MQSQEEQLAIARQLNVIDDVFFQKIAEDPEVCEEILQIILEKPDLKVIDSQTQRFLRNTNAHSVILDLLCQDEDGSYINVEIQKADDDNHQRRVRFNQSNIDTIFIEKGIRYDDFPNIYVIFISKFDIFGEGKTIYHIDRTIRETGTVVNNGTYEIYCNAAVDDGSTIAALMQFFKNSNGENPNFSKLSARTKYFKESKEGVSSMTQIIEEYAQKYAQEYAQEQIQKNNIETATSLLLNGTSVDVIVKCIPSLTREYLENLKEALETPSIV